MSGDRWLLTCDRTGEPGGAGRWSSRHTQLAAFPTTQARYAQVTGRCPSTAYGDRLPVEGVSWLDAVRFRTGLSRREGRYGPLDEIAWYRGPFTIQGVVGV